ncbi:DNA-binding transcriptional LysR family regulator [Silvibacterium bohemicum]|uniref:DNA-binding transcriptional LysR family regulator n=1 Tax=Silvibacterium bohemicum TaxID=1577686 RepID=A0A841K861_9BACT|nr:LysR family transcriptional regulator [Silvibacterium bohemicum]MBB6146758.1 DNA-binding transcriptional LysR family regulator [Silvibacterium bohemicum]
MDGQIAVLAVAEKGSFEAASKYLGIGRSAVRKRVQSVEAEIGTSVFRVMGKRMVPTEAGSLYLPSAQESVRQAWIGMDRVQAFVRVLTNDLRVGYSTYLNTKLLDIVRRIRPESMGSLTVTRESLMTYQAVAGVLQGDLHVGFGILPVLEPDLSTRLLFEEPLMACLPVGHRLATRSTIRPEDLERENLVSLSRKGLPGRHQDIVTHFESLGVSLKFATDAYSVKEALWLVTQGTGISLMTRFSASAYRYDVVVRPISDRLLTVKSGIFTRRDHSQKLISDFVDLAWAETASLRANPN